MALGLAVVITTLPYFEVLLGWRSAMYGDVNDLTVPGYVSVWRALSAGHAPWWNPNVFAGHSMVGAGQYAVFYPLNAIFGLLTPVVAYRCWLLVHLWLATAGAFAWSYHRYRSHAGAIVSGVAYAGSGFIVLHLQHCPFVIATAWMPFVFLGVDMVSQRWTTARAALVAVPLALIAFAGHPQMLWITLAGVGVYSVVSQVLSSAPYGNFGRVVASLMLGLGLAAVQLLPLWLFSRTSVRPDLSMAAVFRTSAEPQHLLTLFFPFAFGGAFGVPWHGGSTQREIGLFAGATIILAACFAVARSRNDATIRALVAIVVVSMLLALGDATPVGPVVYYLLPLASSFRIWTRTIVLANLALALLAGAGIRELLREPPRAMSGFVAAALSIAIVAAGLTLIDGPYDLPAGGVTAVSLLAMTAAVLIVRSYQRTSVVMLVAACVFEIASFTYSAEWRRLGTPIPGLLAFYEERFPPSFGVPRDAPDGIDRWMSDAIGFRMLSEAKNIHGVNGYDPLLQREWAVTAGRFIYDGVPTRGDFWSPGWLSDVLRVTTLVLRPKSEPSDPSWERGATLTGHDFTRWERTPRLAEAYLVGTVKVAPLPAIRKALANPATPLQTSAYIEKPSGRIDTLRDPRVPGKVLSADVLETGRIVVDAERDGMLVLSHSWEDGWRATIDNEPARIVRTNGLVLGVFVPLGHHVVQVWFYPPGLVPGTVITLVSLLVLLSAAPLRDRRREAYLRDIAL